MPRSPAAKKKVASTRAGEKRKRRRERTPRAILTFNIMPLIKVLAGIGQPVSLHEFIDLVHLYRTVKQPLTLQFIRLHLRHRSTPPS